MSEDKKKPTRKGLYDLLREVAVDENIDQMKMDKTIGNFGLSPEWRIIKTQIIEPKIKALLLQADDIGKAMMGEMTVEELGMKTLVARISAGHLQDIIDRIETTAKWVEEEEAKKEASENE